MTADTAFRHLPVTTLADLLALDERELFDGHMHAERGDPEPGGNHSRAYHHGWRTRMMDLHELPVPPEHRALTSAWVAWNRSNALIAGRRAIQTNWSLQHDR